MKRIIGACIAVALLLTGCEPPVTETKVAVSGVAVTPETLQLAVGESDSVSAVVSPGDASNKAFTWSSSNEDIAIVNAEGLVTAITGGTAEILATTTDGGKTDSCTVTVFNNYAVTFDTDGGSSVSPQDISEGGLVTRPAVDPVKLGYYFDGWYADFGKTIPWDFDNNVIEENTFIYAKWVLVDFTIAYELDNGTNSASNPDSYTIESATIVLAPATKASYAFAGWYTDDSFANPVTQIATGSTGNITLYAKWAPYHTVTFNANGGTGGMGAQSVPEGIAVNLNSNTFTAPVSTAFAGWSEDPDATTATYANGGSFTCGTGDVTLYAVWASLFTYTVSGSNATITGFSSWYVNATVITIPSTIDGYTVTTIGGSAFSRRNLLTSVTLPSTLLVIGQAAFSDCQSITSINIPSGLTSISTNAFTGCTSLPAISLPASVTNINDYAFYNCPLLAAINVDAANPNFCSVDGVLYNKAKTYLFKYPETKGGVAVIDSAVTYIKPAAFANNKNITSVTLVNVVDIGGEAFYGCTALETLNLSSNLSTIGFMAFTLCEKLTSVAFPASLQFIRYDAFRNCTGLTSITFSEGIKELERQAFRGCSSITSLVLPAGMTTINDAVFQGCTQLVDVTIGEGLTNLWSDVFEDCISLETVHLPATISLMSDRVFLNTPSLTSITVTAGGASISSQDGVLYNGAKTMMKRFPPAKNGSSYTFPDTVTSFKAYSCEGYQGSSFIVQEGITSLGEEAFENTKLVSLTLPSTITEIGSRLTTSSTLLETIILNALVPPNLYMPLPFGQNNPASLQIRVPAASVSAYQNSADWIEAGAAQYVVSQ